MSEENEPLKDEDYLRFNMELRHDVANALITDGAGERRIPTDAETLTVLKGFLKDNDSSVYTRRRVMVEEAGAKNDKMAAELIESVLNKVDRGTRDGQELNQGQGPDLTTDSLPEFDISEGSTSKVGDSVDLDEIQREGRKVRKGVV